MMTPSEQDEWARATRAGRRKKLPLVYGALAGMAMTVAGFVGVILVAEDRQDRADSGDAVYERRGPNTTLAVLVVPVLLGAAAFVGVFTATGGKLSAEHARALRR